MKSAKRPARAPNGAFVYIFGHAGCGKLTIAKAVRKRFDAILVDNHLINNVVFALIDKDPVTPLPEEIWEPVDKVREIALEVIRDHAKPARSFILTNQLAQGVERHARYFEDVERLAAERGALFLPVRITIEPEELARRIVSPERARKLKQMDADKALATPKDAVLKPDTPDLFELDVTRLKPGTAARRIVEELQKRLKESSRPASKTTRKRRKAP